MARAVNVCFVYAVCFHEGACCSNAFTISVMNILAEFVVCNAPVCTVVLQCLFRMHFKSYWGHTYTHSKIYSTFLSYITVYSVCVCVCMEVVCCNLVKNFGNLIFSPISLTRL